MNGLLGNEASGRKPERIALVGGKLIDGTGAPPVPDGVVLISDGLIEAAGPRARVGLPAGYRVVDCARKGVLPGLADMHVHLCGGWDGESSEMLGFQRYLNAFLYAGVTTVFDVGNVFPFIIQVRREIEAGRIPGPRVHTVGPLLDGPDPFWFPLSRVITSVAQIPSVVAQLKAAGVDALKAYSQLSPVHLQALVREGASHGLPVILDAWYSNGSYDLMKSTGIAAWGHLDSFEPMTEREIEYMRTMKIGQLTTLTVFEAFSRRRLRDLAFLKEPIIADTTPPYVFEELRAYAARAIADPSAGQSAAVGRLEVGLKNAKALHDAGVLLVAGTDAPYPGDFQGEGLHRELELLVEAGLEPVEAIACATGNAARFVRAESKWGTLAPGLAADVIVVDGDPAERIGDSRRIDLVIQGGVPLDRSTLRYDPAREVDFRPVKGIT
ncbi:MAG TPA: amidohydrolase family protein [Bacillota bacterium]